MAGVLFNHPTVGSLSLRLAPISVEWTYNLNTNTTQTYAGEVVQILSVNFDKLILTGRFGKEGPHGKGRPISEARDYNASGRFDIGLTQMTEYFRDYFAIASQGNDAGSQGNYNQTPMNVSYDGGLDVQEGKWKVYPVNFPSYKRTNRDFAPEWRVECEVEEADYKVQTTAMTEEISRLREYVGYFPNNKFSDPFGTYAPFTKISKGQLQKALDIATGEASKVQDAMLDIYNGMLPAYSAEDLEQLITVSGPWVFNKALQKVSGDTPAPAISGGNAPNDRNTS